MWKQNYILVDEYFFFCCTWIVNSAAIKSRIDAAMVGLDILRNEQASSSVRLWLVLA